MGEILYFLMGEFLKGHLEMTADLSKNTHWKLSHCSYEQKDY